MSDRVSPSGVPADLVEAPQITPSDEPIAPGPNTTSEQEVPGTGPSQEANPAVAVSETDKPRDISPEKATHLTVKLQTMRNDSLHEVFFKVKPTTKWKRILSEYEARMGGPQSGLRWIFAGRRLQGDDDMQGLDIEDGDVIEGQAEMIGGKVAGCDERE